MCVRVCVNTYVRCTWVSSVDFVTSYRACQLYRIIGLSSRQLVMTGKGGDVLEEGEAGEERGDKSNRLCAAEPQGSKQTHRAS